MLWRGCVVHGGVVADQHHLHALQTHHAVGLGPAPVVAYGHAHDAAECLRYLPTGAGCEVTFLQMLEAPPRLVFLMAGQMHLAVLGHNLAAALHQDGGVVSHRPGGLLGKLGVAQIEAHPQLL